MIELQRKLLGDTIRNAAFEKALKEVIEPGKTTLIDIGSGTGFLSFLASRLGAKQCTLVEIGDVLEISRDLAKRNKIQNLTFVHGHSVDLPVTEKFDVLVSETLGNYALEENIIESVEDGKRFLKKGGVIIPGKIFQYVCPVVSDRIQKDIDIWNDVGFDLQFDEAREVAMHNMYVKTVKESDLLSSQKSGPPEADRGIRQWDTIDFSKKNTSVRKADETWKSDAPVTIYGLALWWEAELVPGVMLSTAPSAPATHWEQIYLPLLHAVKLAKGESLELLLVSDTNWEVKVNLMWTVRHLDAAGKLLSEQTLDMRRGYMC